MTRSKKEYERLLSLEALIVQLQEDIRLLKNGKKSNTSHTSPSHDIDGASYVSHKVYVWIYQCVGGLPFHLKAPIQYGTSVPATIAYLFAYQYLPTTV